MIKNNKVSLKMIKKDTEVGNTSLEFKLAGPNIDYIVANTIRRTIFTDVPIYAFNDFTFEKNTSIFHNNYIKLRIRQLPIWNIENTVEFIDNTVKNNLETLETINEDENDDVELDIDKTLNSSTLKQMTMYINYKNKTTDICTVTTSDAKFYYGEKQIISPYKISIPIVKLQPGQEIAFSVISKIGTEQENAMYSAVTVAYYKQLSENEFSFCIESRGQITEKRILEVALINIERRIKKFIKLIKDSIKKTDNGNIKFENENQNLMEGIIIANNEDHTLGNLICRGLQQHSNISFAGYNLPHPLVKKVHFHYKLNKKSDIKQIIEEVVDYYSELFIQIKKLVNTEIE